MHPPSFLWFKKDYVTAGLALTMLAMGTTLSLEVRPQSDSETYSCTMDNADDTYETGCNARQQACALDTVVFCYYCFLLDAVLVTTPQVR